MQLQDKVAIVTGGASGLGRAVVDLFLSSGAKVVVLDLPKEENIKSVASLGEKALFAPADVSDEAEVTKALEAGKQKFGGIHIAVNCAGIAFALKTLQKGQPVDLASFDMTLRVNLLGTFNVCRLAAKYMAENQPGPDGERGVLINTASIAAYDGQMGQTAYAASKGGIVALTLPMARDLAPYGIRVLTIAPGIFDTPMLAMLPEPARVSLAEQVPFPKRLGNPAEFAALAKHLVENSMLNGEVIRIDGALRMGMK
ncbi:MAG: 3-hydroxyacyl-CoA dehydrogenase [Deltaproteobacteria bacterium]|nr:3-hydroxyacyl-CoA dehydrogenase [Deltaproteobacteria bacterium]